MKTGRLNILNTHVNRISMTFPNVFVTVYHHFPGTILNVNKLETRIERLKGDHLLSRLR